MRKFVVSGYLDGNTREVEAESFAALRGELVEGYVIIAELVDGVRVTPLPDGLPNYSLMTHLLLHHGDELLEWIMTKLVALKITESVGAAIGAELKDKHKKK